MTHKLQPPTRTGRRAAWMATGSFLVLAMAALLAPAGAAQGTQQDFWNSTDRTFYLHKMQYCSEHAVIRWIDEFNWPNDLDGCGGDVMDPTTNSWTEVFPSFVPFYANITSGTSVDIRIYVLSRALDQTTVTATVSTGYASCSGSDGPHLIPNWLVAGYQEFSIQCTFDVSGAADPLDMPVLQLDIDATYTYGLGTEGDHASRLTLSGVEPAPPEEDVVFFEAGERPRAQPTIDLLSDDEELPEAKGSAPGAGTIVLLAGVAVAVQTARSRRGQR